MAKRLLKPTGADIHAVAFDLFGTLIKPARARIGAYSRLAKASGRERLPFLTRNVPIETFARELGQEHLTEVVRRELAAETAALSSTPRFRR